METKYNGYFNENYGTIDARLDSDGRPVFRLSDLVRITGIKKPTDVKTRYNSQELVMIDDIKFVKKDYLRELVFENNKDVEFGDFLYWIEYEVCPKVLTYRNFELADILSSTANAEDFLNRYHQMHTKLSILEKKLKESKEATEFVRRCLDSYALVDLFDVPEMLNIHGIDITELLSILRNSGVIDEKNMPLQEYVDKGWFRVDTHSYQDKTAGTVVHKRVFCYKLGINQIRKLLDKFAGGK